ncbi:cora-like Mg2+ transporter protein-domain-containing protein [Globomyces pollinis-pini]|nr:cora-like Mg2+ transporter protein-domain-containing protein [Globomyces pollinis-pini]
MNESESIQPILVQVSNQINSTLSSTQQSHLRFQKLVRDFQIRNKYSTKKTVGCAPGVDVNHPPHYIETLLQKVEIQVTDYDESMLISKQLTNESLKSFLDQPRIGKVRWISCQGISFDVIKTIGLKYDLHPLAIEDTFNVPQRIKCDHYEEHMYVSMILLSLRNFEDIDTSTTEPPSDFSSVLFGLDNEYLKKVGFNSDELSKYIRPTCDMEQCSFFLLNNNVVLSIFQKQGRTITENIKNRLDGNQHSFGLKQNSVSLLRKSCDPSFLLHALIDGVVDHHFENLDFYHDQVNELSESIIMTPKLSLIKMLHSILKELKLLKKTLGPTERLIMSINSAKNGLEGLMGVDDPNQDYNISKMTSVYLQDVNDDAQTIRESFEGLEETVKGMIDLAFNTIAHSTNENMKILAVVSLLFLPLTLLCGIYGMNFEFFPELHFELGVFYFWILAGIITICVLSFSYRMSWLTVDR